MKLGRWILLCIIVLAGGFYAWKRFGPVLPGQSASQHAPATEMLAPPGVRIKVEVLNASRVRGLARKATMFLRDRGFDVVGVGTAPEQRATTLVLDRSRHPAWARLVALALNAPMEERPDSSRYLDVTVLLGPDWRPPALPFYP